MSNHYKKKQNYFEANPSGTVRHRAGRDAERVARVAERVAERVAARVAELVAEQVAERVWRESEEAKEFSTSV